MSFKNYHVVELEKLYEKHNEYFESIFEAAENYYNLTTNGKTQIFEKSFEESPENISKATNFLVLNPSNEEDKKKISSYKKRSGYTRVVLYSMERSRILKPSPDSSFYNISKEFITSFPLKPNTQEQKDLLKTIDEREQKRKSFGKTSSDIFFKLTDDEILTFLELLKVSNPNKFLRGVYYIYDLENAQLYEVVYNKKDSKFAFDNLFQISKPYEGEEKDGKFKISGYSQQYEDVQVLGLYFDANKALDQLKEFRKDNPSKKPYELSGFRNIVKGFENSLSKSNEFRDFVEIIKRDYKNFGYDDWEDIFKLAGGMSEFRRSIVKDEPYIIFKSISEFKSLEAKKLDYKDDEYGKVSTVDVVVSNIKSDELLNLMKDESTKLVADSSGYIRIEDEEGKVLGKFWQISLKQSLENSQLGRSQKYFSKIYGMIMGTKEVFEDYKDYSELINESVLEKLTDVAKKGTKFLKEIGKNLFDKISYLIKAFKDYIKNLEKSIASKTSKNAVEDANELFSLGLNESTKKIIDDILIDVMLDPENYYEKANLKIDKLCNTLMKKKNALSIVNFEEANKPSKYSVSMFRKMIFNYSFLKAFKELVLETQNPLEKYIEELLGIYIEAVFGATRMPLWKVYSLYSGKSYEYLGTREEQKELRKGNILKGLVKEGVPVIQLDIGAGKDGSNSISLNMLSNIISAKGVFEPRYTYYKVSFSIDNMEANFIAVEEYSARK